MWGFAELLLGDWRLDQRLVTVEVLAEGALCEIAASHG